MLWKNDLLSVIHRNVCYFMQKNKMIEITNNLWCFQQIDIAKGIEL